MEMPFGKYRGREIKDIPDNYLIWVLQNVDLWDLDLKEEIESFVGEHEFRGSRTASSDRGWKKRASGATETPPPTDGTKQRIRDAIDQWRGKLARRFHPDRGGDVQTMQVINQASDDLAQAIERELRGY